MSAAKPEMPKMPAVLDQPDLDQEPNPTRVTERQVENLDKSATESAEMTATFASIKPGNSGLEVAETWPTLLTSATGEVLQDARLDGQTWHRVTRLAPSGLGTLVQTAIYGESKNQSSTETHTLAQNECTTWATVQVTNGQAQGPARLNFAACQGRRPLPSVFGLSDNLFMTARMAQLLGTYRDNKLQGPGRLLLADSSNQWAVVEGEWQDGVLTWYTAKDVKDQVLALRRPLSKPEDQKTPDLVLEVSFSPTDPLLVTSLLITRQDGSRMLDLCETVQPCAATPMTDLLDYLETQVPFRQELDHIAQWRPFFAHFPSVDKVACIEQAAAAVTHLVQALKQAEPRLLDAKMCLGWLRVDRPDGLFNLGFAPRTGPITLLYFKSMTGQMTGTMYRDNGEVQFSGACKESLTTRFQPVEGAFWFRNNWYMGKFNDQQRLTGAGKILYENRQVWKVGTFQGDKLHGGPGKVYGPDGSLQASCSGWVDDKPNGEGFLCFPYGTKHQVGTFVAGQLHGYDCQEFDRHGRLILSGTVTRGDWTEGPAVMLRYLSSDPALDNQYVCLAIGGTVVTNPKAFQSSVAAPWSSATEVTLPQVQADEEAEEA